MTSLFNVGLHNAAAALLLAIVVYALTRVWRSPPVAHALWLLVLVKLLTPPVIGVSWPKGTTGEETAVALSPAPPRPTAEDPFPTSFPMEIVEAEPDRSFAIEHAAWETDRESSAAILGPEASAYLRYGWSLARPFVIWGWLAGAATWTLVAAVRIARFHLRLRGALPASQKLQRLTQELASQFAIARVPQVRLVEGAAAPFVWPLGRRSTIVLPRRLPDVLDQRQTAMVLAHELAHVRRRDSWVRGVELLVSVVYWWNPLVWWVRRRLHQAEEQCCDAWVSWLFPESAVRYAETLLTVAELVEPPRPAPALASPFLRVPSLQRRIEMILVGSATRLASPRAKLILIVVAALTLPWRVQNAVSGDEPSATNAAASEEHAGQDAAATNDQEQWSGRVVGAVTVEGTGEPVAGATIQVLVGKLDASGAYQSLTAKTDDQGRYSLSLPWGYVRMWTPTEFPPGYWFAGGVTLDHIVINAERPVFMKNYTVRRGPVWRLHLRDTQQQGKPISGATGTAYRMAEGGHVGTMSKTDEQGIANLAMPGLHGDFQIGMWKAEQRFAPREPATLTFETGFLPNQAVAVAAGDKPGEFRITDRQGKTAVIAGAKPILDDRGVILDFETQPLAAGALGKATGLVVDENGRPVEGANVALALGAKEGGSSMTMLRTTTDAAGRFVIDQIPLGGGSQQLSAVVAKDGYAAVESPRQDLPPRHDQPADLGRIRLAPGKSIRIRVVGLEGEPLAGAWLEPVNDYATRTRLTTTGRDGLCVVRDLPQGVQRFQATYGDLGASAVAVVGDEVMETTIRLKRLPGVAVAQPAPPDPVQPGQPAPPLRVSGWTDGKPRTLADFKGQVVVLEFWGDWCGPCIHAIPVMKNLQAKYKGRDVAFLAVHTAGTDMDQVRQFQRQIEWRAHIALDEGDEINQGATVQNYGVRGFPTTLVIERDGRVAFNSDTIEREAGMKALEQAAKALSLPWPLDEAAPKEQLIEQLSRMQEHMFSQAIELALAAP